MAIVVIFILLNIFYFRSYSSITEWTFIAVSHCSIKSLALHHKPTQHSHFVNNSVLLMKSCLNNAFVPRHFSPPVLIFAWQRQEREPAGRWWSHTGSRKFLFYSYISICSPQLRMYVMSRVSRSHGFFKGFQLFTCIISYESKEICDIWVWKRGSKYLHFSLNQSWYTDTDTDT